MRTEQSEFFLPGDIYLRLAPLLNGDYSLDEILHLTRDQLPATRVCYAIEVLKRGIYDQSRCGYVCVIDEGTQPRQQQSAGYPLRLARALLLTGVVPSHEATSTPSTTRIVRGGHGFLQRYGELYREKKAREVFRCPAFRNVQPSN